MSPVETVMISWQLVPCKVVRCAWAQGAPHFDTAALISFSLSIHVSFFVMSYSELILVRTGPWAKDLENLVWLIWWFITSVSPRWPCHIASTLLRISCKQYLYPAWNRRHFEVLGRVSVTPEPQWARFTCGHFVRDLFWLARISLIRNVGNILDVHIPRWGKMVPPIQFLTSGSGKVPKLGIRKGSESLCSTITAQRSRGTQLRTLCSGQSSLRHREVM